jgi:hypothetical protein
VLGSLPRTVATRITVDATFVYVVGSDQKAGESIYRLPLAGGHDRPGAERHHHRVRRAVPELHPNPQRGAVLEVGAPQAARIVGRVRLHSSALYLDPSS